MTERERVVFASGNAGKARELATLFEDQMELLSQAELGVVPVEETGTTFLDNALLKARHAAEHTGRAALGDDSGLEVDFLGGAPGVRSARYSGEHATDQTNVDLLLRELADVAEDLRSARFRCVLVYLRGPDDQDPLIAEGTWEGAIAFSPRGDAGFGYDPIFVDGDSGMTAAELDHETKNVRSHRGRAALELRKKLLSRNK